MNRGTVVRPRHVALIGGWIEGVEQFQIRARPGPFDGLGRTLNVLRFNGVPSGNANGSQ
jgi:hypothetical protein